MKYSDDCVLNLVHVCRWAWISACFQSFFFSRMWCSTRSTCTNHTTPNYLIYLLVLSHIDKQNWQCQLFEKWHWNNLLSRKPAKGKKPLSLAFNLSTPGTVPSSSPTSRKSTSASIVVHHCHSDVKFHSWDSGIFNIKHSFPKTIWRIRIRGPRLS